MNIVKYLRRILRRSERAEIQKIDIAPATTPIATEEKCLHPAPTGGDVQRQTPYAVPKLQDTLIADDAVMTGTLKVSGRVIVEGRMSGVIEQKHGGANVFVDESGVFRGEIYASNTLVYGQVEGSITSTLISIERTAKIAGSIEYKDIRIKGGLFGAILRRNAALPLLIEDKETQQAISH
ncbi:bactofilin family protein [Comamonas thiooxydans]|uniref:bactofilin family protein n=1 Tax=Comamonas thiooxydans TaxID=363952 RepID=UPI00050F56DB|nr:polymer-forming cytoskeletal protein [Comamonas thiooxydans]KGH23003.1 hypothetical protein P606_13295 [Comamonas thiooxydans]